MPKFIVQFQGQESTAELKPGANSIGRQSNCTIPLKDSTLSRLHCEVILAGTVATLVDKGSRNGTLLNGKKIEAQVLQPGDKIQIGATTLWYEKKNVASEAPKTAAVAPSGATSAPSTRRTAPPPGEAPRKPPTEASRKPSTAAVRPSAPAAAPSSPELQDYAFHGKQGGHAGKIVAAALVLAVLGGAAFLGKKFLSMPAAAVEDTENLVLRNAHFDLVTNGKPDGWGLRPTLTGEKSSCSISVDPSKGRNGTSALIMDKSGGVGDLVAECGFQDDLPLPRGNAVAASAWTQFENFNGWAALKVEWLRSPKGAALAEEYSEPVKASSWQELRALFSPPPGAAAFRFSLAILGRSGRVLFDDVSVKTHPGAAAVLEKKVGQYHKVFATRSGVLQIELRGGRRTLHNISIRLESEREGASPQALSLDVTATPDENGLGFEGKMTNPLDFREIVFEERVGAVDGLTNVEYRFRGDSLKQVDRVTVALTLPRVDGPPRGIPEGGEPTDHIVCGSEDGDFAIEYLEPATVKVRNIDGRLRVFQTWKVDPTAEDPSFTFRIKESGGGSGPVDFWGALAELKTQKKYGEALSLSKEQLKKVREAPVKERLDGEIRSLQESERRDWAEAQAHAFEGDISRRPELVDKAREVLQKFLRHWAGEGTELKAKKLLEDLDKKLASVTAGDADRPRRIFDRAKKCVEGGKRALAQTLLQTLVARYPSSEVTSEAQQLLKTLSE